MAKLSRLINEKGQFTPGFFETIVDPTVYSRYKKIEDYLTKEKIAYTPADIAIAIKTVEDAIKKECQYYSFLLFYIMSGSNDWGNFGEQQILFSFTRLLLGLKPEDSITYDQLSGATEQIESKILELGIQSIPLEQAKTSYRQMKINILGRAFGIQEMELLNQILLFMGSSQALHIGEFGNCLQIIFGKAKRAFVSGYAVYTISKETVRSPNVVTSMAALIGDRDIFLRMESLSCVFYQKWITLFDRPAMPAGGTGDPFYDLSDSIKRRCLSLYQIDSKDALLKNQKIFLDDMAQTILFHELGHGIIQHDCIPTENAAIAEATGKFQENIFTSIVEILADFAPQKNKSKGPLKNMIDISRTDITRASRMFYMYLSDVWFYDTEDRFMDTYTDLMLLFLLRYLRKDGSVDFDKLDKDISVSTPGDDAGNPPSLLEKVINRVIESSIDLKKIIESASYKLPSGVEPYKYVKELTCQMFEKAKISVRPQEYKFSLSYWTCIMAYTKALSESGASIQTYLDTSQTTVLSELFSLTAGEKTAKNYQYDHRRYIIDRPSIILLDKRD